MFCIFFSVINYAQSSLAYPRQSGNLSVLESQFLVETYNCLRFYYLMSGENVGRLNVYIIDQDRKVALAWRLTGSQGEDWELGQFRIDAAQGFKVSNLLAERNDLFL